jgi:hypothetical protein
LPKRLLQLPFTVSRKVKQMKNMSRLIRCRGFLLVMFWLFTTVSLLHAQWVRTNVPCNGYVYGFAGSGANIFAGTEDSGIFHSTDNGTSWTAASAGLLNRSVRTFAVSGTKVFAGTYGGVYLSTDNGTSWTAINTGLADSNVAALAVSGANLFAGTFNGVFLSTNNGTSWTAASTGLTSTYVRSLAVSGTNIVAGTNGGGAFFSTNNGTSWTAASAGLTNPWVWSLVAVGPNLFAGTFGFGVFLSTDNGANWTKPSTAAFAVWSLAVSGTSLFAGTQGGVVYLSTDNGTNWTAVNTGLTDTDIRSLAVVGVNLFAGTLGGVIWKRPLSEMITSVARVSTNLMAHPSLDQNYPNPFNPATTISYSLASRSFVSLTVFDALGIRVSTLVSEELPSGTYSQQWNAAGLPSGVYFYHLRIGSFNETKKLVILR